MKHWTPRYMYNRSLNLLSFHILHRDWPWVTPAAVKLLELWLQPTDDVFEWGSGRSTLWMAPRVRSVTSVETNQEWFEKVRSTAQRRGLRNVDLNLLSPGPNSEQSDAYVSLLAEAGRSFDLIYIDGSCRELCALAAPKRLKPGGLLLIDNSNWYLPSGTSAPSSRLPEEGPLLPEWVEFLEKVKDWRQIWTSNGVWDTTIWVKPY